MTSAATQTTIRNASAPSISSRSAFSRGSVFGSVRAQASVDGWVGTVGAPTTKSSGTRREIPEFGADLLREV